MALNSRRIFSTIKSFAPAYLRPSSVTYTGHASCSTSGGQDGSQPPKETVTFDPSKVEELIQNDMPVDIPNPYQKEKIQCVLCKYDVRLDYKNPRLLSQFVSPYTGRIYGRNITRLCRKRQEQMEAVVHKSRSAGYMPTMLKSVEFLKDPKLFDPNNPIRPHNF
ncbi:28S ribosomal protein S18c, mitochondrial-like [Eriocheir sinensis]|uniref:28S ribosomal protein S18c, mitochondrial-like n=1 Tax=Eriocheir sinensis TaxID=95602 RepID=UPI0021C66F41|nr:28S ribosomal protein S18c, mitochondrial-like [Eriocheir sinensis]